MAIGDTPVTLTGNLTADPDLRFTSSGVPVASFTVASTPRFYDKSAGEWKDGDTLFLRCNLWRKPAENTTESLRKGMRVIVTGRLQQRQFEDKEGNTRTVYEVEADEAGPSLKYATAKVSKTSRSNGGAPHPADDPWTTPAPGAPADGNTGGAGPGQSPPDQASEPPF